jgi:hypothetical protein
MIETATCRAWEYASSRNLWAVTLNGTHTAVATTPRAAFHQAFSNLRRTDATPWYPVTSCRKER